MQDYHLGSQKTINAFVAEKLEAFRTQGKTFETLFSLMFREAENVMFERSEGFAVRTTTYGEAKREILARAAALKTRLAGLPRDAIVGLYMENSLDWIECFWAILAAGFRPLLLNLRLPKPLLREAMERCGCEAVIAEGERFFCTTLRPEELAARPEDPASAAQPRQTADGIRTAPDGFGTELLVMSSGTTEHVKVCAYTAEEFYYQIADSYEIIRRCSAIKKHCNGSLKLLCFLPFYHVFGLIAVYIWFAFFSRTFVHLPDLAPQTIVNTVRRHRVTHIFAVPLFWQKVYEQAMRGVAERGEQTVKKLERALALQARLPGPLADAFSRLAFRELRENLFGESIRFLITGGSCIDERVLRFFNGIGYRLANGYGMTEIGITSVELSKRRRWRCGGYVGGPMSNAAYRIDENGELLVRGRVMAHYILVDGRRVENDGWFRTRDLALCRKGHYLLRGRMDDLIISAGGENLNPELLEPQLLPEGADGVCLIGVKQGADTQPVLLVSVSPELTTAELQDLLRSATERIADADLAYEIRKIVLIGEPLLQPNEFKRNRLRLARDYQNGALAVLDPAAPRDAAADELVQQVLRCFADALNRRPEELSQDADFFLALGGTSLDYFAMLAAMQEDFGVEVPMDDPQLRTARRIAAYLRAHQS